MTDALLNKVSVALKERFTSLDADEIEEVLAQFRPKRRTAASKTKAAQPEEKEEPKVEETKVKGRKTAKAKAPPKAKSPPKDDETKVKKAPAKRGKKGVDNFETTDVAKLIEERKSSVTIYQNSFGNWEHHGTGLVWDQQTKRVIGRQLPNGSVANLSENDKNLCKLNQWEFKTDEVVTKDRSFEIVDDEEEEDLYSDED